MPEITFLSDANKRIVAHTALVQGTVNPSTFQAVYVKLPTGANTGPVVCVTTRNFFEPPLTYMSYATGDDPTLVNGVAWGAPYDAAGVGKPVMGKISGDVELCISAGTISAGDVLLIADVYGRVDNLANLGIGAGAGWIYPVGVAQAPSVANGFVEVLLGFAPQIV